MLIRDGISFRITIRINLPSDCRFNFLHLMHLFNFYAPYDWNTIIAINGSYFSFSVDIIASERNLGQLIKRIEQRKRRGGVITNIHLEFLDVSLFDLTTVMLLKTLKLCHLTHDCNSSHNRSIVACDILQKYDIMDILILFKILYYLSNW